MLGKLFKIVALVAGWASTPADCENRPLRKRPQRQMTASKTSVLGPFSLCLAQVRRLSDVGAAAFGRRFGRDLPRRRPQKLKKEEGWPCGLTPVSTLIERPFRTDWTLVSNSMWRPFRIQFDVRFELNLTCISNSMRPFQIKLNVRFIRDQTSKRFGSRNLL